MSAFLFVGLESNTEGVFFIDFKFFGEFSKELVREGLLEVFCAINMTGEFFLLTRSFMLRGSITIASYMLNKSISSCVYSLSMI
jgi:hypothetical protein